jgi:hypothetical protein
MDTYKSREPNPYWPDSGNSQMTCNVVALVAAPVASRLTSAGMFNRVETGVQKYEGRGRRATAAVKSAGHVGFGGSLIARSIVRSQGTSLVAERNIEIWEKENPQGVPKVTKGSTSAAARLA